MRIVDLDCPNCGAQLKVDEDKKETYCIYCGKAVWIKPSENAETLSDIKKAGYESEKAKLHAEEEQSDKEFIAAEQRRINLIGWIMAWILVFPIPLMVLLSEKKRLKPWFEVLLIILAWMTYLLHTFYVFTVCFMCFGYVCSF